MTRTEDRLTDALRAAARHGQDLTLSPLTAPPSTWRRRWAGWLAPAAAAAAVVMGALIVTGALALTGGSHPHPGNSLPPGPPRYYVIEQWGVGFSVRATATGAVTGRSATPGPLRIGWPLGLAAGAGGREFIAAYDNVPPSIPRSSGGMSSSATVLYSFRLTAAGRITRFRPVKGGVLKNLAGDIVLGTGLAISPDGSRVAMAVQCMTGGCDSQIVVIDLRTGARAFWSGGLRRAGFFSDIPSISWAGQDSLVFLTRWCADSARAACVGDGRQDAQVRTLDLTTNGGSLSQGRVLLRESARYPEIVQALLGPGGNTVTIEVARDRNRLGFPTSFQVIGVPLTGIGQPRLLYQAPLSGGGGFARLRYDATGRYLLITARTGNGNGWLDHGKLRPLPPQGASPTFEAW